MRITSRWLKRLTPIMRKDIATQLSQAWRDTPPGPDHRERAVKLAADRCWQARETKLQAHVRTKIFAPHRADKVAMSAAYWGYIASQISELRSPLSSHQHVVVAGAGPEERHAHGRW